MTTTFELDGDTWEVSARGALIDGNRFTVLTSTTRFRQQRNGKVPVTTTRWIIEETGEVSDFNPTF